MYDKKYNDTTESHMHQQQSAVSMESIELEFIRTQEYTKYLLST